jgi:hypothetical protein
VELTAVLACPYRRFPAIIFFLLLKVVNALITSMEEFFSNLEAFLVRSFVFTLAALEMAAVVRKKVKTLLREIRSTKYTK